MTYELVYSIIYHFRTVFFVLFTFKYRLFLHSLTSIFVFQPDTDLGLAIQTNANGVPEEEQKLMKGTPLYMAPEVIAVS